MDMNKSDLPVEIRPQPVATVRPAMFWLALVVGLMVVLAAGAFGLSSWLGVMLQPVASATATQQVVEIPQGATTAGVADMLVDQGLIKNSLVFRGLARYHQLDGKLKAGEYVLSPAMAPAEIIATLTEGKVTQYVFTIPEGYTVQQIANLLGEKGYAQPEVFLQEAAQGDFDFTFIKGLKKGTGRLEGYLFPDTYHIQKGMSEKAIITMMLKRFAQEITPDYQAKAQAQGLTLHQAVTLASIVEREAAKDSERSKVAAVFLNRLKTKMKLESCATVQYAIGEHKERLLYRDLRVESPYNTYKYLGLPQGPISAPGRASLLAVVNPAPVDFLFFVVSVDGQHAFSKTLAEHNRNKAKYVARFKTQ